MAMSMGNSGTEPSAWMERMAEAIAHRSARLDQFAVEAAGRGTEAEARGVQFLPSAYVNGLPKRKQKGASDLYSARAYGTGRQKQQKLGEGGDSWIETRCLYNDPSASWALASARYEDVLDRLLKLPAADAKEQQADLTVARADFWRLHAKSLAEVEASHGEENKRPSILKGLLGHPSAPCA